MQEDILIVCRETSFNTRECVVYDIGYLIKDDLSIQYLRLRQRYNPETEYYGILESNLGVKDYIISLIKKKISSILYTYI